MIQLQTRLKVADNSGAKTATCIKVLGGFKRKFARLGDIIIVSISELRNRHKLASKVKKGEIYKAIIIRTKCKQTLKDGCIVSFSNNSISLINKQGTPLATRIIGPVLKKLKEKKLSKFISISAGSV